MTAKLASPSGRDIFSERMASGYASLTPAARRVVRYIDQNRAAVLANSATELGSATGTSDATVVRSVQALGFSGLDDLRRALITSLEQRTTPADAMRRTLTDTGEDMDRAIALVLETHCEALVQLQAEATRRQIAAAAAALHPASRIVVFGIGPSAPLARYAATLLRRTGRRAQAIDATGIGLADQLLDLREGDALLALAYSRPYREVSAVFQEARRLRMPVVLITDTADSKLARHADVIVPVRRGRTTHTALHGTTLVALEALILGLAASNSEGAVQTLEHLNALRSAVAGP